MKQLTVSQLNNYIKGVFEDELILHDICVVGEIFELKTNGGNTFLTLKDGDFSLSCVNFCLLGDFFAGDKVRVFGTVKYYPKGGKLSFVVKSISRTGEGEIINALKKLTKRLEAEGIFANNRPLKGWIKRVALITSCEGAVLHDFVSVLSAGAKYIDVTVFDVRVQGEGAALGLANAVQKAQAVGFDVVVIARGGGSNQDLNEFNSEALAKAVHDCPVPVVSAVGHEIDYTLCDFAADYRAGTPSIAAELIVKNNSRAVSAFLLRLAKIRAEVFALLRRESGSVRNLSLRCERAAARTLSGASRRLTRAGLLAAAGLNKAVNEKESRFRVLCAKADALSPLKVLAKGYARVTKEGKAIESAKELTGGDSLNIVFKDGDAAAKITRIRRR